MSRKIDIIINDKIGKSIIKYIIRIIVQQIDCHLYK